MAREKKNEMRIRILKERREWLVENHQVKVQEGTFRFINDSISRLLRGKGLTPKQRQWADSIIEDGLQKVECPEKNRKLFNRIEAALRMEHASHNHNILGDFGAKLNRGWDLSEKQLAWCEAMLTEAEAGPWEPSEEEIEVMKNLSNVRLSRNSFWYSSHPRVSQAMTDIHYFLTEGASIRKHSFELALKSFKNRIEEIDSPRFEVGEKCFTRFKNQIKIGFVMAPPYTCPEARGVCYDVLIDGVLEKKTTENLVKNRRK